MALSVNGNMGLEFDLTANSNPLQQVISQTETQLKGLTQTANQQSKSIENFGKKAALALGGYLSLNVVEGFISKMATVRGQFQQLEVSFTTMLGSKVEADKLMQQVTQFAATTPFELTEVATAAKQLLAFGISADKIEGSLRNLGDVAAGIGAPLGDIAYLYGTIKTAGKANAVDIKQFAQRGIPIYEELAKVLKVNVDAVGDLVSAGKVGFPEIEAAFQGMTAAGSKFGGLMEAQSQTINGLRSNLSDAIDQMFNDLGKSQEGIIADIIRGATSVVENYQKVVDIIQVLIVAYGSYRAALIVTTALQAIQIQKTAGYTLAMQLQYKWMLLTEGLMKSLRLVMLAMPTIALTAGIAALGVAIYSMATTTNAAVLALEKINDISAEAAQRVGEEKSKIEELLKVYNDKTRSHEDQAKALEKIISINPAYLAGLNAQNIATAEGKKIIDDYLLSLNNKAKGEAAYAAKTENLKRITELQTKGFAAVDKTEMLGRSLKKFFSGKDLFKSQESQRKALVAEMINELQQANDKIDETFGKQIQDTLLGKDGGAPPALKASSVRNEAFIKKEIERIQDLRAPLAVASKEYEAYSKQIEQLQRELNPAKSAKAATTEENKYQQALERRKNILNELADLHREAIQSGLTKEASEIDKINEKYDITLRKVNEYNKATKRGDLKITPAAIQAIGADRATEINNAILRRDAEEYKKNIDAQKEIFEQFEKTKTEVGIEQANKMYEGQTKGFDSFLAYLKSQQSQLQADLQMGGSDVGLMEKIKSNATAIVEAQKEVSRGIVTQTIQDYKNLLAATEDYQAKRKAIEDKYSKLIFTAFTTYTGEKKRQAIDDLEKQRQLEITSLSDNLARQSELYQQLNADVIRYTREQLKEKLKLLKQYLKDGFVTEKNGSKTILSPEMINAAQQGIGNINGLLSSTRTVIGLSAKEFENLVSHVQTAASGLHSLGDAIAPLDEGLGNVLNQMGDMADLAVNALGAMTGDPTAIIGTLTGIIKLFSANKAAQDKHRKEMLDFQTDIFNGEQEINILYRERERTQININKLKIQGLKDEAALLAAQTGQILDQYKKVFDELQKETFKEEGFKYVLTPNALSQQQVAILLAQGNTMEDIAKKYGTAIKTIIDSSLSGKSFEQIEELFLKGQLNDKAKELFQTLQRLKQEGVDVDKMLADNKRAAQEAFTGTSSDSIVDSLLAGFKEGKRAAADFADDFQSLMQNAILQSLKYQALEKPLKDFYEQFAQLAESDGALTQSEIDKLQGMYNTIIGNASTQFEQLQQLSGINFSASGNANSLQGAIKGMTQQQADLLAGQFGGLRLTLVEQLRIAQSSLMSLQKIENHTASTVAELRDLIRLHRKWDISGLRVV